MSVEHLFTQALNLAAPWKVVSSDFDPVGKSLKLVIDFERGARFTDPDTGESCPVHDTVRRNWEHLRFFAKLGYRLIILLKPRNTRNIRKF